MNIVYVHRGPRWCVLRAAHPGGRITTLCCDWLPYAPVCITTAQPPNICPACATELAAGTLGAAVAADPDDWGGDSQAIRSALDDHEDLLDVPVVATP